MCLKWVPSLRRCGYRGAVAGRTVAVLAAIVVASSLAAESWARPETVRWFHSPSGNIQCEVAAMDTRGTYAYCQTFRPLQTATLRRDGHTTVCSRNNCSVGNGPENARTLAYGSSIRVGTFRCTSSRIGMRCEVLPGHHGFKIARSGVATF